MFLKEMFYVFIFLFLLVNAVSPAGFGQDLATVKTGSAKIPETADGRSAKLKNGEYRVELNGVSHWYKVAGAEHRSVPLVIVHGGPGGNVYNFERIAGPQLEKFATVVYYEQRGSGRSTAPTDADAYSIPILVSDLEALREKLGFERIIPLGFSFGGELALEYALSHPERVERLILQCPSTGDWEKQRLVQINGFQSVADTETARQISRIAHGRETIEERWNQVWNAVDTPTVDRLLFHDQNAARINRNLWDESQLKNNGQMYRGLIKQPPAKETLMERARRIKTPTLILIGIYDRNVGVDAVRDLAGVIPTARLAVFEKSAHFPDIEETTKYAKTVKDFVSQAAKKSPR
jgi:proline iminopeptidase